MATKVGIDTVSSSRAVSQGRTVWASWPVARPCPERPTYRAAASSRRVPNRLYEPMMSRCSITGGPSTQPLSSSRPPSVRPPRGGSVTPTPSWSVTWMTRRDGGRDGWTPTRPAGRTGFGCPRQALQLPTPADRRTTLSRSGAPTSPRPVVEEPGPPLDVSARTTLDRRRAEPAPPLGGTFADSYLTDADGATSIELTMRGCRPQPACRVGWRRRTR
jgi:hypothetical protein